MSELGELVRGMRLKAGLTQSAVAEAVGCSTNYVSLVERGASKPSWRFIVGLAAAVKAPVIELLQTAGLLTDRTEVAQAIAALASADPEIGELLALIQDDPRLAGELLPFARFKAGERRREKQGVGDPL